MGEGIQHIGAVVTGPFADHELAVPGGQIGIVFLKFHPYCQKVSRAGRNLL